MTQVLKFLKDAQGVPTGALPFPPAAKSASLAAGSTDSLIVPDDVDNWVMFIEYQDAANIWVAINDVALPPAGATFADTTSICNPKALIVAADDEISFKNNGSGTATVSVYFYAIP